MPYYMSNKARYETTQSSTIKDGGIANENKTREIYLVWRVSVKIFICILRFVIVQQTKTLSRWFYVLRISDALLNNN